MSELLALGVSYKTAPVALRERLALTETAAERFVKDLVEGGEVTEGVVISTCNRTEFYLVVNDAVGAEVALLSKVARRTGMRPTELSSVVYAPRNCDAARHLFRVTSGLESMIVGEHEVQGQVKRSYEAALASGTTGPLTNRLFTAALKTGKRVRTETEIGVSRTSVSSVAVDLAQQVVGDLASRDVVIIGAGETSELTARAFAEHGVTAMFVANRHADRARALAARIGGSVVSLDDLPARMESADVVVSSTSSPHPIVGVDELALVMEARGGRPLVLIDLAVPRDIEAACADLPGVTLLDIDDLQRVVAGNLLGRETERDDAVAIVEEEILRFASWMGQLDVLPTIAALREQASIVAEQVLAENAGRWESASPRDLARVDAMARAIVQRVLHEPTLRIKALADADVMNAHPPTHGRLETVRELFGLQSGAHGGHDQAARPSDAEVHHLHRRSGDGAPT